MSKKYRETTITNMSGDYFPEIEAGFNCFICGLKFKRGERRYNFVASIEIKTPVLAKLTWCQLCKKCGGKIHKILNNKK